MPKFLDHIINDLKQWKNIEAYIFILLAIVIAIFDLFDIAKTNWITSITLIILAMLIFGRIEDRRVTDRLVEYLGASGNITFLDKYPDTFEDDINQAKDLWIVGVSLNRTIISYYTLFRSKLKAGDKIRVLLVKPNSDVSAMATKRDRRGIFSGYYDQTIIASLNQFCKLAEEQGNDIQIRVSPVTLTFGYYAMDTTSSNGVIYMEHYGYKIEEGDVPKLVLRPDDGKWYEIFHNEIRNLWEDAEVWECKKE